MYTKRMWWLAALRPKAAAGAETRTFGTMTPDLLTLADWLREAGVTQVAMESTGVYWKPIYNLLEGEFDIILVNAKHIKYVPGRKTDVKDAQWIAQLLQHGLLKASFVPPTPQRHLRDLVRYRTKLIQDRTQEVNRVQKVLEDANLKLASVVSDVMGLSAREMLSSLIAGQDDPQYLAQLARGRMRSKMKSWNVPSVVTSLTIIVCCSVCIYGILIRLLS